MSYNSGDQFILKLLAENLAKLENYETKKDDVQIIEESHAVIGNIELDEAEEYLEVNDETRKYVRCPDSTTESLATALVYKHLKEVSPKLAAEFSNSCKVKLSSIKLQEVVAAWQKKKKPLEDVKNCMKTDKLDQRKTNSKVGGETIRFTPQEDKVIMAIVKEAGESVEDIDCSTLAHKLNRTHGSVFHRVRMLIRTGGWKEKRKSFSLVQDQILLETLVIQRLRNKKLSEVVLKQSCCTELAKLWNINYSGITNRWTMILQPILLQHFSGTLNLKVERMLANYVLENYTDFSQINWSEVAVRDEFVGYTELSLRKMYYTELSRNTRKKFGVENSKMTPQHVAQYCETVYGEGGQRRRMGSKKIQRQTDVITFFKDKVAELGIVDFL